MAETRSSSLLNTSQTDTVIHFEVDENKSIENPSRMEISFCKRLENFGAGSVCLIAGAGCALVGSGAAYITWQIIDQPYKDFTTWYYGTLPASSFGGVVTAACFAGAGACVYQAGIQYRQAFQGCCDNSVSRFCGSLFNRLRNSVPASQNEEVDYHRMPTV